MEKQEVSGAVKAEKSPQLSSDGGDAEKQLSKEVAQQFGSRVESSAVDDIYERKCYILNKVLNEHIGMGKVQWQVFFLSGFGWFCDNMWLQGVAIALPQVSREFNIPSDVRWMTFSLYIGLIFGAATWGILADVIGRRPSFNITLCLAGIFGIAAGGAPSFVGLGGLFAALGFGLGGNLPVDGTLFLEFVPANKQYLLTLLSVFWSIGQLVGSLIGWAFIANYSCSGDESNTPFDGSIPCNTADNKGWRYFFFCIGAITFVFFLLRFAVFKLPESPKFYLAKGRDAEAVATMKEIARRNGIELGDDVLSVEILRSAAGQEADMDAAHHQVEEEPKGMAAITSLPSRVAGSFKNVSFTPDLSHIKPLFRGAKMAYTTSAIFMLWSLIGLAYPLYNAFLPIYLERAQGVSGSSSVDVTYRNYAIISICGVPGSIIAAYLVELPRTGRRGAMALGTLLTGIFLFAFTTAKTNGAVLGFNCVTALTQNIMYGVLYSWTPETFPAPHRGTADGIASSLNRIFGAMAPIIGIYAVGSAPIYVSASLFIAAALIMVTVPSETVGKNAL